ncbi:MAG: cohesin domain-containing protein [Candidatus Bathyarchaeia archaeon]
MSKTKSVLFLIMLVLGLVFLPQSLHVQAQSQTGTPTVSFEPQQYESLNVGDNFTVYLRVDNATGIYAAQVEFTYDALVLNVTKVVEGPFMPSVGPTISNIAQGMINDVLGGVNYSSSETFFDASRGGYLEASGSGILLNVTFTVLSEASSNFHLLSYAEGSGGSGTYFLTLDSNLNAIEIVPSLAADGFYGSPISLVASQTLITVGDSVMITGKISGSSSFNITSVDLVYSKEGGNWSDLASLTANSTGYFSYQWTPTESGPFEFQITYTTAGKTRNSPAMLVIVQPSLHGYGIYVFYALAGVIAFIVAVVIVLNVRGRLKRATEPPPI